jgi:hypothetical protein
MKIAKWVISQSDRVRPELAYVNRIIKKLLLTSQEEKCYAHQVTVNRIKEIGNLTFLCSERNAEFCNISDGTNIWQK